MLILRHNGDSLTGALDGGHDDALSFDVKACPHKRHLVTRDRLNQWQQNTTPTNRAIQINVCFFENVRYRNYMLHEHSINIYPL